MSGKPVRVTTISDYYGGAGQETGGAGASALRIARVLNLSGMLERALVGFGSLPPNNVLPGAISSGGRDLRETSKTSPIDLLSGIWNNDAKVFLEEAFAGYDFDDAVVCLHQWTRFMSPAGIEVLSRYRHIVYVHDYFWMCPTGAYYNFQTSEMCTLKPGGAACVATNCDRGGYAHKLYRVARHWAKALVANRRADNRIFVHISERSRQLMLKHIPDERHFVLYHCMDIGHPRLEGPIDHAPTYDVGYLGRLEPEKGVLETARTVSELGMSMLCVGAGSARDELAAMPGITVRDWIPSSEVRATMQECAYIILPSLWQETWGLVIPEALSAGRPVIVSERAGSCELVERFGGGLTFNPSVEGALKAVLETSRSETLRHELTQQAWTVPTQAGLWPELFAGKFAAIVSDAWNVNLARSA
jgi:glycosyltransferase involved in cell wall biosynthesis